jgi:hypothetical protein
MSVEKIAVLTEAGIIMNDGEVIRSGVILEIVRDMKKVIDQEDDEALDNIVCEERYKELSDDDKELIRFTAIRENGYMIHDAILDALARDLE